MNKVRGRENGMGQRETMKKKLAYVHIYNCWLVLIMKKLGLEIITINLPRPKSINLHTFHSVHSSSFKNRIM